MHFVSQMPVPDPREVCASSSKFNVFVQLPTNCVQKLVMAENESIRPICDLMTECGLSLLDHKLVLENPHCELEISRSTANMTLYELNIRPNEVMYVVPISP